MTGDAQVNTDNQTHFEPCPFCGAGGGMIYRIEGKNVLPTGEIFKRPELFCDACKATVYFEDSSSKGIDDLEDMNNLKDALTTGWNARPTEVNTVTNDDELREKIAIMQFEKNVMDCLLIARGKGRTNMVELLPIFRDLLAFITAERAKAVLDARINELMCHRDYNGLDSEPYLLRRITELQTKRKALDE